jgi:pimeloyl-ACP methyl ester carboxylesterase
MLINHIKKLCKKNMLLLVMLYPMTASAMANINPVGSWYGEMLVSGNKIPLIFHISNDDSNEFIATMDSPAQGAKGIPVKGVMISDRSIKLNIAVANALFEGQFDKDSILIQGVWQQGGQKFPLILKKKTEDILGLWKGKLQGTPVEFSLDISINENNQAIAYLSPNGGISKVEVSNLVSNKTVLSFEVPAEGVKYSGNFNKKANGIEGVFSQGSREFALTFSKAVKGKQVKLDRPQHPLKPYLYNSEDIVFNNEKANVKLAGTLTTPTGKGPYPAVVLISGSGPQDRDQTFMGHKTFLVLSDYLTKSGIAVLRFDDRGYGKSTGNFSSATSLDFASDVKAAAEFLGNHSRIDASNIGLIGHSEGGLIAPIVASQSDDIAFIVLMAGPGISGNDIAIEQIKTILSLNGLSQAAATAGSNITRQLNEVIITSEGTVDFENLLTNTYKKAWSLLSKPVQAELKQVGGGAISKSRIDTLSSPWNQYFLTHQPEKYLSQLSIPVMAIHGSKDKQMLATENLKAIEAALHSSPKNLVLEMDGLNHLFQTANSGLMSEYSKISETIAPQVLNTMKNWILNTVTE